MGSAGLRGQPADPHRLRTDRPAAGSAARPVPCTDSGSGEIVIPGRGLESARGGIGGGQSIADKKKKSQGKVKVDQEIRREFLLFPKADIQDAH